VKHYYNSRKKALSRSILKLERISKISMEEVRESHFIREAMESATVRFLHSRVIPNYTRN